MMIPYLRVAAVPIPNGNYYGPGSLENCQRCGTLAHETTLLKEKIFALQQKYSILDKGDTLKLRVAEYRANVLEEHVNKRLDRVKSFEEHVSKRLTRLEALINEIGDRLNEEDLDSGGIMIKAPPSPCIESIMSENNFPSTNESTEELQKVYLKLDSAVQKEMLKSEQAPGYYDEDRVIEQAKGSTSQQYRNR